MRAGLLFLFILGSMPVFAVIDADRDDVQQRIQPVGRVHLEEPLSPMNATQPVYQMEKEVAVKKSRGQAIYEQYCVVCHQDGLAGAPKFRNKTDWEPRLAKQTINGLTSIALKGLNAMPAKGTCQECTDADIKAAIEYMVPAS